MKISLNNKKIASLQIHLGFASFVCPGYVQIQLQDKYKMAQKAAQDGPKNRDNKDPYCLNCSVRFGIRRRALIHLGRLCSISHRVWLTIHEMVLQHFGGSGTIQTG